VEENYPSFPVAVVNLIFAQTLQAGLRFYKEMSKDVLKVLFWFALVSSWIAIPLFYLIAPFALALWLVTLFLLVKNKLKHRWYLLVFSAWTFLPLFNFFKGTFAYLHGTARMVRVGYPAPTFYNLNKEYRTWNSSSGCIVYGHEGLTHAPNNAAIALWTNLFGYQRNVYAGVYPDKSEAVDVLTESGEEVQLLRNNDNFNFILNGQNVTIKPIFERPTFELEKCGVVKAAVVNNELVIAMTRPGDVVYLADKRTGEIFAELY
jgi:energy-coupling factor transporter transmembrane protein EcfT